MKAGADLDKPGLAKKLLDIYQKLNKVVTEEEALRAVFESRLADLVSYKKELSEESVRILSQLNDVTGPERLALTAPEPDLAPDGETRKREKKNRSRSIERGSAPESKSGKNAPKIGRQGSKARKLRERVLAFMEAEGSNGKSMKVAAIADAVGMGGLEASTSTRYLCANGYLEKVAHGTYRLKVKKN